MNVPGRALAVMVAVCEAHSITLAELRGERTARRFTRPRQEAYWRLREMDFGAVGRHPTITQIGAWLNRDHTTVLHGLRRHEERTSMKPPLMIAAMIRRCAALAAEEGISRAELGRAMIQAGADFVASAQDGPTAASALGATSARISPLEPRSAIPGAVEAVFGEGGR